MLEKTVLYLARELSLSKTQADIVRYGLQTFTATLVGLAAVVILAAMAGVLYESMAATLAIMFFRKASGGAHCKTLAACSILGAVVMTLLGLATRSWGNWLAASLFLLLLPSLVAAIVAFWRAPADVPQKPITSAAQRSLLRRLSLLWVTLWGGLGLYLWLTGRENLLYYYTGGNLGLLWQSLMLTPAGYRLIRLLDLMFP